MFQQTHKHELGSEVHVPILGTIGRVAQVAFVEGQTLPIYTIQTAHNGVVYTHTLPENMLEGPV